MHSFTDKLPTRTGDLHGRLLGSAAVGQLVHDTLLAVPNGEVTLCVSTVGTDNQYSISTGTGTLVKAWRALLTVTPLICIDSMLMGSASTRIGSPPGVGLSGRPLGTAYRCRLFGPDCTATICTQTQPSALALRTRGHEDWPLELEEEEEARDARGRGSAR